MRQLNLNLNIKLSPTPEFIQLASMLIEGLKDLSTGDPDAPFIQVEEQVSEKPKAVATPKAVTKVKTAKAVEPTTEGVPAEEPTTNSSDELSAENLRALVIEKTKKSSDTKEFIATTMRSYKVSNITQLASLPESKKRAFLNTIKLL